MNPELNFRPRPSASVYTWATGLIAPEEAFRIPCITMPAILGFPGKGLVSPTRVVLGAVAVALILLAGWHRDTLSTSSDLRHQISKLTSYRIGGASLNDVSKCAEVVNGQKRQLTQVFGEVLKGVHNIMLIGLPNHPNK